MTLRNWITTRGRVHGKHYRKNRQLLHGPDRYINIILLVLYNIFPFPHSHAAVFIYIYSLHMPRSYGLVQATSKGCGRHATSQLLLIDVLHLRKGLLCWNFTQIRPRLPALRRRCWRGRRGIGVFQKEHPQSLPQLPERFVEGAPRLVLSCCLLKAAEPGGATAVSVGALAVSCSGVACLGLRAWRRTRHC